MYTILLGGGSGSGKTLWARELSERVSGLVVLGMDRYYRDLSHLPEPERSGRNFDAPESFDLPLLCEQMTALRGGESVDLPVYDYHRHVRARESERLAPPPFLLIEGILALAVPELRERADLLLFIEVPPEVAYQRRLERDVAERGRTPDSVARQYEASVRPMHERHVWPSASHAHLLITGGGRNRVALDLIAAALLSQQYAQKHGG